MHKRILFHANPAFPGVGRSHMRNGNGSYLRIRKRNYSRNLSWRMFSLPNDNSVRRVGLGFTKS